MTDDDAAEVLRLQLVALTGFDNERVVHGPIDAARRTIGWITQIPLSILEQGGPQRTGTILRQATIAEFLVTAYGSEAVTALRRALAEIQGDTPKAMQALAAGVTMAQTPRSRPSGFVPAVVRTANEPRQSVTLRIGYIFESTVEEPPTADSIRVDLTVDGGSTFVDAIVVGV